MQSSVRICLGQGGGGGGGGVTRQSTLEQVG